MDYFLSDETQLEDSYVTSINGFWHNSVTTGTFDTKDKLTLAYACCSPPQARGTIVICSGRIEAYLKYKEMIFDLYQNHYSVFILDHRGQGLSDRLTANREQGHVEDFKDYVSDLHTFMQDIVLPQTDHKPFLLGHSMGSAIGTLYLLEHPDIFAKAVFSAPMYGIKTPLPSMIAKAIVAAGCWINSKLGKKPWYFISQTNYMHVPFHLNVLTHSKARYKLFRQEYDNQSKLKLGGVTFQWLQAALDAINKIGEGFANIHIPLLVLQAEKDHVVDNKQQNQVINGSENCRLQVIPGARHELLMESDAMRRPAIESMLNFFQEPN